MERHVYPSEPAYETQMRESGSPHHHPQIVEDLKRERVVGVCGICSTRIQSGDRD
jgi:hypothetical protein